MAQQRLGKGLGGLLVLAALASCATPPDRVATIAQPKTPVAKTITNFSQAKQCMDRLLKQNGRRGLKVTSEGIPDSTGTVNVSTRDMMISALSDMSLQSGAFEFFTLEQAGGAIVELQKHFSPLGRVDPARLPGVYIRGSISQSDNNVASDSQSASVTLPFISIGGGKSQVAGTISIDLQMASIHSRQILQGVTTSNTITIVHADDSASARGLINQGGFGGALSISLSSAEREGRGQAVRTLMEYSLIELIGKWTRLPYARCLQLPSTDPQTMQAARQQYDDLDAASRTRALQIGLASLGEYTGAADGVMSYTFQDALTQAKAKRGLVPDGRVDFQIFNALHNENALPDRIVAAPPPDPALTPPRPDRPTRPTGRDPIGLSLELTRKTLSRGDRVTFSLSVEKPAHVYCYYEFYSEGQLATARIFPNRFHHDNVVRPGQPLLFPRPSDPFEIILNSTENEAVGCVATTVDYTADNRPSVLDRPDLEPIAFGPDGVAVPIYEHQGADTLNTTASKISFRAVR